MLAYLVNQLAHRETGVENVWIANPDDRLKLLVHGVTMLGPLSQLLDSRALWFLFPAQLLFHPLLQCEPGHHVVALPFLCPPH